MQDNWKDRNYSARYNRLYDTPASAFASCARRLRLTNTDRVVDFGCGNGDFLAAALRTAASGVGVDIADAQLEMAAQRFKGNSRIELVKSSFLDFTPGARTFTRGFSRKALHHLTDAEKMLFFARAANYFEPKSLFLLEDGIFEFERSELETNWDRLMKDCEQYYGQTWEEKRPDVVFCFRQEHPTSIRAWTSALAAGGFSVLDLQRKSSFYGSLLAEKN